MDSSLKNVVIIYLSLFHSKNVYVSSVKHKYILRNVSVLLLLFFVHCQYDGSQWSPRLFGYRHSSKYRLFYSTKERKSTWG